MTVPSFVLRLRDSILSSTARYSVPDSLFCGCSHVNRLRVEYILSEPDDSWEGARGRVRNELLWPLLPEDIRQSDSLLVCICGSLPFTKAAVKCLEDLQCPSKFVHAFLG